MSAIDFYAKGGETFKESGCNITTNSFNGICTASDSFMPVSMSPSDSRAAEEKCVTITAHDSTNTADRSFTTTIPAKWLTTDKSQLVTLDEDFKFLLVCLESPSEDEKAKNPLLKENEQAKKDHCHEMSLRINDVPGFSMKSNKAPHFSFTAMKKEQPGTIK